MIYYTIEFSFKGTDYGMKITLNEYLGIEVAKDLARTIRSNLNFENVILTEDKNVEVLLD